MSLPGAFIGPAANYVRGVERMSTASSFGFGPPRACVQVLVWSWFLGHSVCCLSKRGCNGWFVNAQAQIHLTGIIRNLEGDLRRGQFRSLRTLHDILNGHVVYITNDLWCWQWTCSLALQLLLIEPRLVVWHDEIVLRLRGSLRWLYQSLCSSRGGIVLVR